MKYNQRKEHAGTEIRMKLCEIINSIVVPITLLSVNPHHKQSSAFSEVSNDHDPVPVICHPARQNKRRKEITLFLPFENGNSRISLVFP